MATIFTVHGTFASSPESGEKWWQKGSQFESELRRLIEGEDGKLDFAPHVWNGLNSETSRRAAGKSLFSRLLDLEKQSQRYCLIGHSHGGSVILSALMRSTHRRRPLKGLSRWISVGTPFIAFDPKSVLFSRLGLLGKAAYLSIIAFESLLALVAWLDPTLPMDARIGLTFAAVFSFMFIHTVMSWNADRVLASSGAFLTSRFRSTQLVRRLGLIGRLAYVCALAVAITFITAVMSQGAQSLGIRLALSGFIITLFLGFHFLLAWWVRQPNVLSAGWLHRWLALRHSQDEAIEGLRQLPHVSFPIFGRDFAVAPLTLAAVLAVPMLLLAAALSPGFSTWLVKALGQSAPNNAPGLVTDITNLLILPVAWGRSFSIDFAVLMFFTVDPAFFFVSAIVFVTVARFLASLVSRFLSTALDRTAWRQIRASAYGDDTNGEIPRSAGDAPSFVGSRTALPRHLAAEISKVADAAAAASLSKLRGSLNRLAFGAGKQKRSDLVSEYLTWDELIHTAYFKVPLFRKLVAYSIAHSEGFRPSSILLADPDYKCVAGWYEELTSATLAISGTEEMALEAKPGSDANGSWPPEGAA
jgi:hypothetical protein